MSEKQAPNEHGYFRSKDGLRLFYSCEGPKDAPPLLFCYGLVCSKLQWKYQMEHFKKNYRVIYMDYRGHNKSDSPENPRSVTIENIARDLGDLCDELQLPPVCLLGHSLGVNILLEFYRLFPEKVSSLVLAHGTPKNPFSNMFHHNFLQVLFPAIRLAHDLAPDIMQKIWKNQGQALINQEFVARAGFNPKYAKREDINEYLRITSTVRADIFLNLLENFTEYDATHWLDEIRTPTFILSGDQDLITPPVNQKIFHRLIPKSVLYTVEEGSHCAQMEKPEEVNAALENFFQLLQSRSNSRVGTKKKKSSIKISSIML